MNTSLIMLLLAVVVIVAVGGVGWGIGYFASKGKNPQEIIKTADTIVDGVKTLNDDVGKILIPGPVESIIDRVIQVAQAGVHTAEQMCNSNQINKDQRNQTAYDAAMNLLNIAGYQPTPEIQKGVKDMLELGVFDLKNQGDVVLPAAPDQAVHQAVADVVKETVTPIAQQAASDAIKQAISQTVQAVQGALAPQVAQAQVAQADTQSAQANSQ